MGCFGLIGLLLVMTDPPAPPSPTPDDLKTYQAERSLAGRDAEAHVRLALWCERHGMPAERLKHLAIAVMSDPSHAAARGLLGFVSDRGTWLKPDQVAERARADERLAAVLSEYASRREKASRTVHSQWELALWCERHGLAAEAKAHLWQVTRLSPNHEDAWKHLGCKKYKGRWLNDDQIAAEQSESRDQAAADRKWGPLLHQWKEWLSSSANKVEADRLLSGVSDLRATPSIWRAFVAASRPDLDRAVRLLGQVDSPASSRALAVLAIDAPTAEVRRLATEILRQRNPRDYLDFVIARLRDTIRYQVRRVGGPGTAGAVFVEGTLYNEQRIYAPPAAPFVAFQPGMTFDTGPDGLPVIIEQTGSRLLHTTYTSESFTPQEYREGRVSDPKRNAALQSALKNHGNSYDAMVKAAPGVKVNDFHVNGSQTTTEIDRIEIPIGRMIAEAQLAAMVAESQLEGDVAAIDSVNAEIRRWNDRLALLLSTVTGTDQGNSREGWRKWWVDFQGYAYSAPKETSRPTLVENIPSAYQPRTTVSAIRPQITISADETTVAINHSCFAAGTPVRTLAGPRPIETLVLGDQVLTQNTTTGALTYQPIFVVYHNPPNRTLRVTIEGDEIVCTGIHRLWSPGRGWVMARELKPGDRLRTLGGVATVRAIEEGATQKVFNLEVAAGQSFFVGEKGVLAHDNSVVSPTAEPFDARAMVAAKKAD